HEPLLAELLPAELARRFVDPAGLSNERLAPAELEALHGSILARLSPFAGLPQRAAALAGTWRARLEAPAPARPADGDGA
ncbi:MAG TPA: hypothetical protein VG939_02295, partial [Caulobacteraceae bacterium]|nr:hypothetical protein [Caulobacteraceae bacterium]